MRAIKTAPKQKELQVAEPSHELTVAAKNTNVVTSSAKTFLTANTVESTLEEVKSSHIIPVFSRDGEPLISHADFIEATLQAVKSVYPSETMVSPSVRLSHEVRGRVPEARNKPAKELLEHEKTIHYERMAFVIDIPSIQDDVDGNLLSLSVGGVKNYTDENLSNKKGVDEHFKVFIGFKNTVCCNMCVWSDGVIGNLRIKSLEQLLASLKTLFENYSATSHLDAMKKLSGYSLSEKEFAQVIGRCRMYQHLPPKVKQDITPLLLNDTQLSSVVKDYYQDNSFCRDESGNINLWKLYNLFTNASKTSYIDSFLERTLNSYSFVNDLRDALDGKVQNWFLN